MRGLNIAAAILLSFSQLAAAETTEILNVTGDTYINGRRSTTNYDNSGDIVVHNFGPKIGLVKFNTSRITGANISNAKLEYRLNKLRASGTIDVQLLESGWAANDATYATRPTSGGTVLTLSVSTAEVGRVVSIDITPIVQGWANGTIPNHGLQLNTNQNINAEIDSTRSSGSPMRIVATIDDGAPTNAPPELSSIGAQSVTVGDTLSFQVTATDPDGTTPTLSADNLPGDAEFNAGWFNWTPGAADIGTYTTVSFTAADADDSSLTDHEVITVTVNAAGDTTNTLTANQDSYINGKRSNSNYGGSSDMVVHNYGPKVGLVQFDTAALNGVTVTEAKLYYRLNKLHRNGTVDIQLLTSPWAQSSVNYSNQPGSGGTVQSFQVTTSDVGKKTSIDVTAIVQGWINGSLPNHGLRLSSNQNIKAEFDTLESSGSPIQLVVSVLNASTNSPPQLNLIPQQSVEIGDTLEVLATAHDADGSNSLAFSASQLPSFASMSDRGDGNSTVTVTPAASDVGQHEVTLRVTDDGSPPLYDEQSFTITVTDGNAAPDDIQLSNDIVSGGATDNSLVGMLSTSDANTTDTHDYTLNTDADGLFKLGSNNNELRIANSSLLDPSGATNYEFSITSTDSGLNPLSLTRSFTISVVPVLPDTNPPEILVTSHALNEGAPESGFIVSGYVSAENGVANLSAKLNDPLLGETINRPILDFANSGRWSLAVLPENISRNQTVTLELTATDQTNEVSSIAIQFHINAADFAARQAINRITFGATPALLHEVRVMGAANFIAQQLYPENIDDSALEGMLAWFNPSSLMELQRYQMLMAKQSKRQLREVMTAFWDNHFNTYIHSHGKFEYEYNENNLFRANALGNFRNLLDISAKSPAMLIYLNNVSNEDTSPNENYARELLELHTMGVNGGYTQTDVEEVARIFTGWRVDWMVEIGDFYFNPTRHDDQPKYALGQDFVTGGQADGEELLDLLATHPSTAQFICHKLVQLFVADVPPATLIASCAQTFLATSSEPDQLRQVVALILSSDEFYAIENYRSKIKTPLEFTTGGIRMLYSAIRLDDALAATADMGMPLWKNHIPTGYSETGDDWVSSTLILERMRFAGELAFLGANGATPSFDPVEYFLNEGYETAEGIVGHLLELSLGEPATAQEWQTAYNALYDNNSEFDIQAPDANARLRELLRTVMSYPAYNYQ